MCLYVCTHLKCMRPSFCTGGEERRRENEQGGRVYAFSPSLLIINVSQVCKIASRSLCSILPSSSPPLAFLSLVHSVFFPPPLWRGLPHPLHLNLSPNTRLSLVLLCALREEEMLMYLWGNRQQASSQDAHHDSILLTISVGSPGDSVLP